MFFKLKILHSKKRVNFLHTPIFFNLLVPKESLVPTRRGTIIDKFNVKKFELGDERKMNRERNRDNIILGLIGHK